MQLIKFQSDRQVLKRVVTELIDSFYDILGVFFGPLSSLFCLPTYKGMCPFYAWNYIQVLRTAAQPYFTALSI